MKEIIDQLRAEVDQLQANDAEQAEQLRIKYLGKKGSITALFDDFKSMDSEAKRLWGKPLNELKSLAAEKINQLKENTATAVQQKDDHFDWSRPAIAHPLGSRHPVQLVRARIIEIFAQLGFSMSDGPEIEDDWHNFSALNFPEEHPARDMQDTFFVTEGMALRTHTSSVQVRLMESQQPPIRSIMPGRVFRNEAISSRSHCIFHQVEGLYIDKDVSFADLKQTLLYFAKEMFGKSKIRLRPSYFPFTEPSAEMDVYWGLNSETDYRITKGTGWLEILGCGMVDPNVLENCGIDSKTYSGFAFGMGIERMAMLLYGIDDIRMYFENDVRFLRQFSSNVPG
ncbi:MAG TPA: phenylalanine--tRNA ligase subunit alpha [Luteibaculaceae bacterium]|nr:phenylalanine--tRNA ligase subunit alpha [Luteibaculaceae bacterium]